MYIVLVFIVSERAKKIKWIIYFPMQILIFKSANKQKVFLSSHFVLFQKLYVNLFKLKWYIHTIYLSIYMYTFSDSEKVELSWDTCTYTQFDGYTEREYVWLHEDDTMATAMDIGGCTSPSLSTCLCWKIQFK